MATKNDDIDEDDYDNQSRPATSRSHHRQTSLSSMKGQTFRDMQENIFPSPNGKKHIIMGKKLWQKIVANNPKVEYTESAVARGVVKKARKIISKQDKTLSEEQKAEIVRINKRRLAMMTDYFDEKIEEYAEMMEKCEKEAMQKRERLKKEGTQKRNARSPYIMSCTFYSVLTYGSSEAYKAYRKLRSHKSSKMGNYDHILYDEEIREGFEQMNNIKFIHLISKPYQCWMNLFEIDENSAKQICEVGLLLLEHFNKVGRFRKAFPLWLINLRNWELSIAHKYLTSPVYVLEVIEHIKDGNYWTRYHKYLREEDDDVYLAKWSDGTDYFPHRVTALYWFQNERVTKWLTYDEYMQRKQMKTDEKRMSIGHDSNLMHGTGNNDNGDAMEQNVEKSQMEKTRESLEKNDILQSLQTQKSNDNDADIEDNDEQETGTLIRGGLEYLNNVTLSENDEIDIESEEEVLSDSDSGTSEIYNVNIYRCPLLPKDEFDSFHGWTAFHRSFVDFISRDLLEIAECERQIVVNAAEDHWKKRHLAKGNIFDFPLCQYRLIEKKMLLTHIIRENLRMIAMIKSYSLSYGNCAHLTQSKYMKKWIELKAKTHFNSLYPQIRAQQIAYTPNKKQLLNILQSEIEKRKSFNAQIRQRINAKKEKLTKYLSSMRTLNDRQINVLSLVVSAKHRVENEKLKVQFAKKQVDNLEADVEDLRSMLPKEARFAAQNKRYFEDVTVKKMCKEYHSLKRNNFDPNKAFLSVYRNKIKQKIKEVAMYNLWFWAVKERYKSHEKLAVILKGFEMMNPTKDWNPSNLAISELFHSNEHFSKMNSYDPHKLRKEEILFKLKEEKQQGMGALNECDYDMDDEKKSISQLDADDIEFNKHFSKMKAKTSRLSVLNGVNVTQEKKVGYKRMLDELSQILHGLQSKDLNDRRRDSVSSRRRRVSEQYNFEYANEQKDDHTFDEALAGAPTKRYENTDDDEYESDSSEYDEENVYSEDEDESESEYESEYEDDESRIHGYYDDRGSSASNIQTDSDSVVYTDEYDEDEEEEVSGRRMSHKRDSTEFYDSVDLKHIMGDSVASHLNQQRFDDDDDGSVSFDESESLRKSEDEYEDEESSYLQTEESEYESEESGYSKRNYQRNQQSFSVYKQPNDDGDDY